MKCLEMFVLSIVISFNISTKLTRKSNVSIEKQWLSIFNEPGTIVSFIGKFKINEGQSSTVTPGSVVQTQNTDSPFSFLREEELNIFNVNMGQNIEFKLTVTSYNLNKDQKYCLIGTVDFAIKNLGSFNRFYILLPNNSDLKTALVKKKVVDSRKETCGPENF